MATLKTKVDRLTSEVAGLRGEFAALRGTVSGLVTNLPRIIGDVVREVLREREQK